MPLHGFQPLRGRVETLRIQSRHLENNLLGDPTERSVSVYLPPNHRTDGKTPLLVDLVGFTGSGFSHLNWKTFGENVPQRHERLVDEGKMGPCAFAFPDCFTSLGGNQYVDSKAMGDWAQFLIEDMLPTIETQFGTKAGREGRGVFGKSSGGFGAIYHGMRYADAWGAIACHSGDMGFDRIFLGDFPKVLNVLKKKDGISGFLRYIDETPKLKDDDLHVLMILAMGASYDPDPAAPKGIRLPVDPHTCELITERWNAWLAYDPVVMINTPECQQALRSLRGLYIDCGDVDQYHIHYGTRQLVRKLQSLDISHVHHEFEDNHSNIDYRMDESLPFLYHALSNA